MAPRRIQINENIEIRELVDDQGERTGTFGVYPKPQAQPEHEDFLKLKDPKTGQPKSIRLQEGDILVLPAGHTLDKLDLMPRDMAGNPMPKAKVPLLVIENQGKSLELAGQNLAVMGNATVRTTQVELAGIDTVRLEKEKKITIKPGAPDISEFLNTEWKGRRFDYGDNQHIVALDNTGKGLFSGSVTFVDANSAPQHLRRLLTLDGDTSSVGTGQAKQRIEHMQRGVMLRLDEAYDATNKALKELGVPRDHIKPSGYSIDWQRMKPQTMAQWQVDEKAEEEARQRAQKKPFSIPAEHVPEGRKKADTTDATNPKKSVEFTQQDADRWSANPLGLPSFVAYDAKRLGLGVFAGVKNHDNADAQTSSIPYAKGGPPTR